MVKYLVSTAHTDNVALRTKGDPKREVIKSILEGENVTMIEIDQGVDPEGQEIEVVIILEAGAETVIVDMILKDLIEIEGSDEITQNYFYEQNVNKIYFVRFTFT